MKHIRRLLRRKPRQEAPSRYGPHYDMLMRSFVAADDDDLGRIQRLADAMAAERSRVTCAWN